VEEAEKVIGAWLHPEAEADVGELSAQQQEGDSH